MFLKLSRIAILTLFIAISLISNMNTSQVLAFDETRITNNMIDDSYVDMAVDNAGKVHLVYQRALQIYHWVADTVSGTTGTEELIANGTDPSIAIGPSGELHVSFINSNMVYYTKKTGGAWQLPVGIAAQCVHHDIAIDNSNNVHIVYQQGEFIDYYLYNIFYTHGAGAPFSDPVKVLEASWSEVSSFDWYYHEYFNPSIAIDSSNNYHIVAESTGVFSDSYSNPGTYFWINYVYEGSIKTISKTNHDGDSKLKLSSNSIVLNSKGSPYVSYHQSGRLYIRQKAGTTWKLLVNKPGRNGAIGITPSSEHVGVAYIDGSSVHYIENNVASGAIASGSGPVLAYGSKTFIAYAKETGGNKEIFLASGILRDCDFFVIPVSNGERAVTFCM